MPLSGPRVGDDWLSITDEPLPIAPALEWVQRRECGAVVLFLGTVRDHAEGRPGVSALEYEAYEEEVGPRLSAIAAETHRRWPACRRLALLHRVGRLEVGETSVVVAASSAHRADAFTAARFAIDTLKATVPIWKRETWAGGEDWSVACQPAGEVPASAPGATP